MTRTQQYARFQIGDACLYQGKRYMIVAPIWIDPFPGSFTWHIERLIDHDERLEMPTPHTLEWVMENGVIETRGDGRYQVRNISEDALEDEDDNPTWEYVNDLKARYVRLEMQVAELQRLLKTKFRRTGIKRRTGDAP